MAIPSGVFGAGRFDQSEFDTLSTSGCASFVLAPAVISAAGTGLATGAADLALAPATLAAEGLAEFPGGHASLQPGPAALQASGTVTAVGWAALTTGSATQTRGPVQVNLLHRLACPRATQANLLHRLAASMSCRANLLHRLSNNRVTVNLRHRLACANHIQVNLLHRLRAGPGEISIPKSVWGPGPDSNGDPSSTPASPYELAYKLGIGDMTTSFQIWSASRTWDLGEAPAILQVTHNESAPLRWQIYVDDPEGKYHPRKSGGEFAGAMDNRAYDSAGGFAKKFLATVYWGGSPYHLIGIPNQIASERNNGSGGRFRLTWGGIDCTEGFFRRANTAKTLRTVRGGTTWFNVDALRDICEQLNVSCDFRIRREKIRVQHRQNGRWGDWFQSLLDATRAKWRSEGERIVAYQPTLTGPALWNYDSKALILEENLDAPTPDIVNKVTARRANEGGGSRAEVNLLKFGSGYKAVFNPPIDNPQFKVSGGNLAAVSNVVYRDPSGAIVGVSNWRTDGMGTAANIGTVAAQDPMGRAYGNGGQAKNVNSAEFTWGITVAGFPTILESAGNVTFFAAPSDPTSDPVLELTGKAPASIGGGNLGWGEKALELPPNPLFYDSAQLKRYLYDYLLEFAFDTLPTTYKVFLNHEMRPGDLVAIHDDRLGLVDVRYVYQCTHSFSDFPEQRFTRMSTRLYPTEIMVEYSDGSTSVRS